LYFVFFFSFFFEFQFPAPAADGRSSQVGHVGALSVWGRSRWSCQLWDHCVGVMWAIGFIRRGK